MYNFFTQQRAFTIKMFQKYSFTILAYFTLDASSYTQEQLQELTKEFEAKTRQIINLCCEQQKYSQAEDSLYDMLSELISKSFHPTASERLNVFSDLFHTICFQEVERRSIAKYKECLAILYRINYYKVRITFLIDSSFYKKLSTEKELTIADKIRADMKILKNLMTDKVDINSKITKPVN